VATVLSIQSYVALGHVGNRAALLALERLGHEVWAVPTVLFSNHPAHGGFRGRVLPAAEVAELVAGVADRGVLGRCDAVLSGYLGEAGTGAVVADAVARVRAARPGALYWCDPVIGEAATGPYVRPGVADAIRERLLPLADLCTPNAFELATLAGVDPAGLATVAGARAAAEALRRRGPAAVVVTGLGLGAEPGRLATLAVAPGGAWLARVARRPGPTHGAGDLFTALLLGDYLAGGDLARALGRAVATLDAVLAAPGPVPDLAAAAGAGGGAGATVEVAALP
jgi:pyridoxine kinase